MLTACGIADGTADDDGAAADDGGKADGTGRSDIGYIQANTPFYWGQSDYADFLASTASIGYPTHPVPLGPSDALTQRLQSWIDRIDAIVRAEVEASTGQELVAPKPVVEILPTGSTFNAWVSTTVACTGTTLAPPVPPGTPPAPTTITMLSSTMYAPLSAYHCVRPTYPGIAELATFWNRHKPACKINANHTVSGTGCTVENTGDPGELAVFATAPYIHVSSDLIAAVSERTLAVVLAHELGHYYRAHVSEATVQRYNFWYDSEPDRKKVPVAAANAADLQAKYAEIVAGPRTVQPAVAGRYSPRLRTFLLTAIAPLLGERTELGFVCAAARDAVGPWVSPLLDGYGTPTDATDAYLAFETKLAACASHLALTGDPGATSLSYGTVLMAVMAAKLPGVTLPFRATLADVIAALDAKARRLDAKQLALQTRIASNRIGLYTIEEEADDIALEISARLGIRPADVLASWFEFMQAVARSVPADWRMQIDDENTQCKARLDAGFVGSDGKPSFVPIGDLSEPHHSDCYRLFNFWREQKLRKYSVTTPYEFGADWAPLQEEAAQLSATARTNGQ